MMEEMKRQGGEREREETIPNCGEEDEKKSSQHHDLAMRISLSSIP